MCIMEVRPGQRTSTIAQACAHNTSTVERDLDMFRRVLLARNEHTMVAALDLAQKRLYEAYANLLDMFTESVGDELADAYGHVHGHDEHDEHGAERTLVAQAHHDATLARRYETR